MQLPCNRKIALQSNQLLFKVDHTGNIIVEEVEQLLQRTALNTEKSLERYGNTLSQEHKDGIFVLSNLFSQFLLGEATGRIAVPMPTGAGKTTAIIALIKAIHELDLDLKIAVCAEKVEGLCQIKRSLIAEEIPEARISLIHSYTFDCNYRKEDPKANTASEKAVIDFSRPILLATHQKVKGRALRELAYFDLIIWDEGLLKSEGQAVRYYDMYSALDAWNSYTQYPGKQTHRHNTTVREYLTYYFARIQFSLRGIFSDDGGLGYKPYILWDHPQLTMEKGTLKSEIYKSNLLEAHKKTLKQLIESSGEEVRCVRTAQGDALVSYQTLIPKDLRSVVILDASYPVRTLAHWDNDIQVIDPGFEKDYSDVTIYGWKARSGRTYIEEEFGKGSDNVISAEIANIIRDQLKSDPDSSFLIVTFKDKKVDIGKRLQQALTHSSIDTEREIVPGKKQITFLTWGNETSLNDFANCNNVILAGILHLPHQEVAARALGQVEDLKHPITPSDIADLHLGEQVHMIYQALSRGSCRVTVDGKAKPMNAWLFHDELETIKEKLALVMPGVAFQDYESRYLIKGLTKEEETGNQLKRILEEFRLTEPDSQIVVSSKKLRSIHSKKYGGVNSKLFQRAGERVTTGRNGWSRVDRSYIYQNRINYEIAEYLKHSP